MNVFYIPSWYPDRDGRVLDGIFFQEMVRALAGHHPELRIFVSLWGQTERNLSLARLRFLARHPWVRLRSRPARAQVLPNLVELCRPTWSWRYLTGRGNVEAIFLANRRMYMEARAECGSIDLIHAQVSFPAGYLADRLGAETGVPHVITEHMSRFPFPQFVRDGSVVPEVAEPLRRARRVTAVGRELATQIREKTGVTPVVIPNGVDERFFTPGAVRNRAGFTFLTVATLEPRKGIEELLRAIHALGPRSGVRFRISGLGTQEHAYHALAARLGIEGRVDWLGQLGREAVRNAMRDCDAFVLTSRRESFGMVFAEAIACGKPVIATRCGGPEDIVRDVNGLLVPVGDVEGIARALDTMIEGASRYDAAAIRADFESRFSSRIVSRRYADLYAEAVGSD
ncbi:MAG TPA: glycosyltransferase [Candidatus Eisenbacteria bacterium]|nr:glycosyltransferase [Candidatus Eisenbacteria bacterium]